MITKFNFSDRTIKSYAIRKLTPFECFRLMGVRDAVIRTMQMTWGTAWDRIKSFFTGKRGKDDRGGQIGECPDLRATARRTGGVGVNHES